MSANRHVLVQVGDGPVPGLLLRWRRAGEEALVTYEAADGRLVTEWLPVERVQPTMEEPAPDEPLAD